VQIEDKILQMLADSSGDILDDEELINNLAASKSTSEAIGVRMREAETTSIDINEAREQYRPVVRGAAPQHVVCSATLHVLLLLSPLRSLLCPDGVVVVVVL
jgi:dynein heavy chain